MKEQNNKDPKVEQNIAEEVSQEVTKAASKEEPNKIATKDKKEVIKDTKKEKEKKKKKFKVKDWYSNRYQIIAVQRNILLVFAIFSVISMAVAIIFVQFVISSKTLEPYVIEIQEKNGIATVVDQITSQELSKDALLKKYFINKYIKAASAYNPKSYEANVETVRVLSSPSVYNDFRSRTKGYGNEVSINTRIKTIRFKGPSKVEIRVVRTKREPKEANVERHEIITINYKLNANIKLSMEDLYLNPIKFQVTQYSIIEEAFNY